MVTLSRYSLALASALTFLPLPAQANKESKIEALIANAGLSCKKAVAVRYPKTSMADITIELGATLRQQIDAGAITLKEIKRDGLSFDYSMQRQGHREHVGYCNTDGEGTVTDLQQLR